MGIGCSAKESAVHVCFNLCVISECSRWKDLMIAMKKWLISMSA